MDKLAIAVLLLSILAVLYAWKVHKRKMHASRRDPSLAHRHTDFICRRDWVEHITGMTEPELRAGDKIRSVIRAERVPEYSTYKFTFVNAATKAEYEAGYFYTETVGSMQREFDERPGDKSVFRSCKFIADLRQDYVTHHTHTPHILFLISKYKPSFFIIQFAFFKTQKRSHFVLF